MNHSKSPLPSNKAAGRKRDEILAKTLAGSTSRFLKNFDFKNGMHGLELGSGTGEITFQLRSLLGQEGKMTGLDSDPTNVNIAREKAALGNCTNVVFFQKDISTLNEKEHYDFVYSRLLFNQLSQSLEVLKQIFKSIKKGGWVMVEDMELSHFHCHPNSYAFERYSELVTGLKERQGMNAAIGGQLYSLLRNADFEHVRVQVVQPTFLKTEDKRIPSLSLESKSDELLTEQLATASELQALLLELKGFENRPDTLITLPGIYQAWGYKGY